MALVGEAEPGSTPEQDNSGVDQDEFTLWFAICRQNVTPKTLLCHVEWLESVSI